MRHLARWELAGVDGAVVVVDVIRALTTAAYAFASGAAEIYLVASVDEALAFKAASLVVASATARAVVTAGLGEPAYVITGRFEDHLDGGADDVLTAELIERARTGRPLETVATAAALLATEEATKTLVLGSEHTDPRDIALAAAVDAFDFAMEVERTDLGLRLAPITVD